MLIHNWGVMANHEKIDIIFLKFRFPQVFQTIMVNDFFGGKTSIGF